MTPLYDSLRVHSWYINIISNDEKGEQECQLYENNTNGIEKSLEILWDDSNRLEGLLIEGPRSKWEEWSDGGAMLQIKFKVR